MSDLVAFLEARIAEDAELVETIRSGGFPAPTWITEPSASSHWAVLREPDDPTPLGYVTSGRWEHAHVARHDPARVLREVAAKRRIVNEIAAEADGLDMTVEQDRGGLGRDWDAEPWLGEALLRIIAVVYSDHPDYDPAWKPEAVHT